MSAEMSVDTALSRLAQYGERATWSTATYDFGTERALYEIALNLAAEVRRLRGHSGSEVDVQYAIRAAGEVMSHRTGADWGGAEVAYQDTAARVERYRDCLPGAVVVRREVRYGPWEVVSDSADEPVPYSAAPYVLAEADSPAARLAASLAGAHQDVVGSEGIDDQTLRLHVRPDSARRWQWWLRELGVPPEQVTYRDGCATAKGRTGGVRVLLVGQGVPDLMRAAMEVGSW